jgi:hypothetical protein
MGRIIMSLLWLGELMGTDCEYDLTASRSLRNIFHDLQRGNRDRLATS